MELSFTNNDNEKALVIFLMYSTCALPEMCLLYRQHQEESTFKSHVGIFIPEKKKILYRRCGQCFAASMVILLPRLFIQGQSKKKQEKKSKWNKTKYLKIPSKPISMGQGPIKGKFGPRMLVDRQINVICNRKPLCINRL